MRTREKVLKEKKRGRDGSGTGSPCKSSSKSVERAFDAISREWDKSRRLPHKAFPFFVAEFSRRLAGKKRSSKAVRVLDAGCGNCRNAIALCELFPCVKAYCLDFSAGMLHVAKERISAHPEAMRRCFLRMASVEKLPYADGFFDSIMCFAVLHHLSSPAKRYRAFREIRRVLSKGGFAFVTVWARGDKKAGTDFFEQFPVGKGGGPKRYYHLFSEKELRRLCTGAGLLVASLFHESKGNLCGPRAKLLRRNLCLVLERK